MAADPDHPGRAEVRCHRRRQREAGGGRHHRDGKGDRPSDGRPALRARAGSAGRPGAGGRGGAAPVLCPPCASAGAAGRPLRPCQTVQAHAQGIEKAEGLHRPGHARPAPPPAGHPRGQPAGPDHRQARPGLAPPAPAAQGERQDLRPARTEVDCISKGKARVRYEFGCKVSVATTLDEGFVVGMRSFTGNPTMAIPSARRWNR